MKTEMKTKQFCIKGKTFGTGRPLICLPVTKKVKSEIIEEIARLVELHADVIEWRVDAYEEARNLNAIRQLLHEVEPIVKDTPFLYTFRSKMQGGLLELSEEEAYDIRLVGAETKVPDLIDLEFFAVDNPAKEIKQIQELGRKVITSHHDFNQTPDTKVMEMILSQMRENGADIVKLAVMPNQASDVIRLLEVTEDFYKRFPDSLLITMSMGDLGKVSRITGEVFGSCMTFGSAGEASAPGQIELEQLSKMLEILSVE